MSNERVLGSVSEEELAEIRKLHNRRTGLNEVITSLSSSGTDLNGALYERLIDDMSKVSHQFHDWWDRLSTKYGWPNDPRYAWRIDFATRQITLTDRSAL